MSAVINYGLDWTELVKGTSGIVLAFAEIMHIKGTQWS